MMTMTDYKAEWLKEFDKLARRTDFWQAFKDWCGLFAIEISTRVDLTQPKDRLKEYATIARRYDKDEKLSMAKMAALMVAELDRRVTTEGYQDVLGEIFHELDVQNKYKAQFFTPNSLSEMMGRLAIGDDIKETLKHQPFITMNDAACGSGSTIYGGLNGVRHAGGNPCRDVLVVAGDVDERCVYMCYIQLSLYGIPAIVMRQNALTLEEPDIWYTPVYVLDGWWWKNSKRHRENVKQVADAADIQLNLFDTKEGEP